jgi:hypothetical protein
MWNRVPCDTSACMEFARKEEGSAFLFRSSEKPYELISLTREEVRNMVLAVKAGWLDEVL